MRKERKLWHFTKVCSGGGIKSTTEQVTTSPSGNSNITQVPITKKMLAAFVDGNPYIALVYISGTRQSYTVHVQDTSGNAIGNTSLTLILIYTD